MRRSGLLIIGISILTLLFSCRSTSKIEYNIYEGLREEDKAFITASVENGAVIFKENCAKCHGIFKRGKKDVTNFKQEVLHDYKQSFLANDEDNHAVIFEMSEKELDNVLLFLTFIKRN